MTRLYPTLESSKKLRQKAFETKLIMKRSSNYQFVYIRLDLFLFFSCWFDLIWFDLMFFVCLFVCFLRSTPTELLLQRRNRVVMSAVCDFLFLILKTIRNESEFGPWRKCSHVIRVLEQRKSYKRIKCCMSAATLELTKEKETIERGNSV